MRGLRENLAGACWLSTILVLAFYFFNEGLEAQAPPAAAAATAQAAAPLKRDIARILSVRPGPAGEILVAYEDARGGRQSLTLTAEGAAQDLERLSNAPDLATFLRGYAETPLVAGAPLNDPRALQAWVRDQMTAIDRPSAAEYPTWFRSVVMDAARRMDVLSRPPGASRE